MAPGKAALPPPTPPRHLIALLGKEGLERKCIHHRCHFTQTTSRITRMLLLIMSHASSVVKHVGKSDTLAVAGGNIDEVGQEHSLMKLYMADATGAEVQGRSPTKAHPLLAG